MLKALLRWLDQRFALPAMPRAILDDESQARINRLNEMYDDLSRLTHAEWLAKWRPDEPTG
jgi:hypothetical protein